MINENSSKGIFFEAPMTEIERTTKMLRGLATGIGAETNINENAKLVFNKKKSETVETTYFDNNYYDVINNDSEIIGNIQIQNRQDYYRISNSHLDATKTGLGTEMYEKIAFLLDKPLYSDVSRTTEANKLWNKLIRIGIAEKFNDENDNNKERYRILEKESISEAYCRAKSDGSNPELVKTVEEIIKN
jgi:hypothetical protein